MSPRNSRYGDGSARACTSMCRSSVMSPRLAVGIRAGGDASVAAGGGQGSEAVVELDAEGARLDRRGHQFLDHAEQLVRVVGDAAVAVRVAGVLQVGADRPVLVGHAG